MFTRLSSNSLGARSRASLAVPSTNEWGSDVVKGSPSKCKLPAGATVTGSAGVIRVGFGFSSKHLTGSVLRQCWAGALPVVKEAAAKATF